MNCRGTTKAGNPCRAAAGETGLCYLHENPDRARTIGQSGGRKNGKTSAVQLDLPDNLSVQELRKLTLHVIRSISLGDLAVKKAGALVPWFNLLLRVIPSADLEMRVANLEEQVELRQNERVSENQPIADQPYEMVPTETDVESAIATSKTDGDELSTDAALSKNEFESRQHDTKREGEQ